MAHILVENFSATCGGAWEGRQRGQFHTRRPVCPSLCLARPGQPSWCLLVRGQSGGLARLRWVRGSDASRSRILPGCLPVSAGGRGDGGGAADLGQMWGCSVGAPAPRRGLPGPGSPGLRGGPGPCTRALRCGAESTSRFAGLPSVPRAERGRRSGQSVSAPSGDSWQGGVCVHAREWARVPAGVRVYTCPL